MDGAEFIVADSHDGFEAATRAPHAFEVCGDLVLGPRDVYVAIAERVDDGQGEQRFLCRVRCVPIAHRAMPLLMAVAMGSGLTIARKKSTASAIASPLSVHSIASASVLMLSCAAMCTRAWYSRYFSVT